MTVQNFALNNVLPNPFQTRKSEDPEHIKNLAMDIAKRGLLQIPSARTSVSDPNKVELAFGHSRLAAFKLLADESNNLVFEIPLNIVEMTDAQMFEAAVSENLNRKDLTPIEEAMAMQVYLVDFHKTSEEVGQLFHLSDSAVRGKLRLLKLPPEIRDLVGTKITEGGARELVTFYDLPAEILDEKTWDYNDRIHTTRKDKMVQLIDHGASAELIKEELDGIIERAGKDLDKKPWKHTDELVGDGIVGQCKGCPFLQKRDNHELCLKSECFDAKTKVWRRQYLSQAHLLSGIPVLEDDRSSYSQYTEFGYGKDAKLEKIRTGKCENLRLKFYEFDSKLTSHQTIEGFEHAQVVCCKSERFCNCLNALEKKIEVGQGAEQAAEILKEQNRLERAQKKIDKEVVANLVDEAAKKIFRGLLTDNLVTWKKILSSMWSWGSITEDIKDAESIDIILWKMAEKRAKQVAFEGISSKHAISSLNVLLEECGLDKLDVQIEQPTPAEIQSSKVLQEEGK